MPIHAALRLLCKGAGLLLLLAAIQFTMLLSRLNPIDESKDYWEAWVTKHSHLVGPGENRLILAGGSNVAFGIDSSQLEAVSKRHTINIALHAGVGLEFMLREVSEGARAGDLVIFIPEYEQFYGDLMDGEAAATELLQGNPSALCCFVTWRQWFKIARNTPGVNKGALFNRLAWIRRRMLRSSHRSQSGSYVYRSNGFDAKGDMLAHLDLPRDDAHFNVTLSRIHGPVNDNAFIAITRCGDELAKRGARLVVVYPGVAASYWEMNKQAIQAVAAGLPSQWTITTPEEWVFEDKIFYDTHYHLNREGRALRTSRLAAAVARTKGW